ncbi:MAG: efflux RND transporter periplasmic adaptor subunit [Vicinamibacterales bacterium]
MRVGVTAIALGVSGCADREEGQAADAAAQVGLEPPAVAAVQAREGTVPLRERLTGTVRASGEVAIFPQVSGRVAEVFAQNGDAVTKGEPLVRIQAPGSQAQVTQASSALTAARASLTQAEAERRRLAAEYERQKTLGDQGLVPQNIVDTLRSQLDAAQAAMANARAQVEVAAATVTEQREVQAQTVIRAPISGRVGQRNAEVGMLADTQVPLFIVGRLENVRVEVPVTQDVLARIRPRQRVEIRTGNGQSAPIEARVSRISPFLQAGSFSAEVEIDVPNEAGTLVAGMFVTVDIFHGESEPATLVPTSAVYEHGATGQRGVFVADGPPPPLPASMAPGGSRPPPIAVPFRAVEIVAEAAQTVGVEGVKPGEWVVVIGQHLLSRTAEGAPDARVRPMEWDRILELQQLQREDLLEDFLDRQRAAGAGGGR